MANRKDQGKDKKKKFTPVSPEAEKKKDIGAPGGGAGRVEEAGGSGVYPASGPWPKENAPFEGEMSWGQGKRGQAGYNDSGDSEITPPEQQQRGAPSSAGRSGLQTQEIPREQWVSFFDSFSRQHRGWLVDVTVSEDGQKAQPEARGLPLQAVAVSDKPGDDNTISIILGRESPSSVTRSVSGVRRVLLEKTAAGADAGLMIEGRDGKTHLQFRSPAAPETLNGISAAERQ